MNISEESGSLTYREYKTLSEGSRIELHEGYFYATATPTDKHQRIFREIFTQFSNFLSGKSCEVWDNREVRLFPKEDESDYTVYIPDLFVLCDRSKDKGTSIKGAPDLIAEIWSPCTGSVDLLTKKFEYQDAGVKEYWIIRNVHEAYQYILEDGLYREIPYTYHDSKDIEIPVNIWDGRLVIKLGDFIHQPGVENP